MSTDDVTHFDVPCACKQGTITITATSPDHPWARDYQTNYDATINCPICAENYVVHATHSGRVPDLAPRQEFEDKQAMHDAYWKLSREVKASPEATRVRVRLLASVNGQSSKAAQHRALAAVGLGGVSYQTFLKHSRPVEMAIEYASGGDLARIGSGLGGDDQPYFVAAAKLLDQLHEAEAKSPLHTVKISSI